MDSIGWWPGKAEGMVSVCKLEPPAPPQRLRVRVQVRQGFLETADLARACLEGLPKQANLSERAYYTSFYRNARELHGWLEGAFESAVIPLPRHVPMTFASAEKLPGASRRRRPHYGAVTLTRLLTQGWIDDLVVQVKTRELLAGGVELRRRVLGLCSPELPLPIAAWLVDLVRCGNSVQLVRIPSSLE